MGFWGYAEVEDNSVLVHQIVIIWWILFYAFRKVGEYIYIWLKCESITI